MSPAASDTTPPGYRIDAVERALQLLDLVAEAPGLGVAELARRAGLTKSRTFRLLGTLQHGRYLSAGPGGYRLGPQAFVLGVAAVQDSALVRCAQWHMQALHAQLGVTVVLRVRERLESVCIARADREQELALSRLVGNRRPLFSGASGKVLLAYAPDEIRERFIAQQAALQGRDAAWWERETRAELQRVQQQELAISQGERAHGRLAIAVPVRDASGAVVASLSLSTDGASVAPDVLAQWSGQLQRSSRHLSSDLGF
ncbi:IclR family transcriptional regulator [Amphibiibacter pelophylacis]|uniref:IclR family transcriptional regulator n=1 Tax=Amphibiibacter pelophylacis TaxID=1799477 RepID=A0ACC6P447_9BURK